MDYITLGSTPCSEECAAVGQEDYLVRSMNECNIFIRQLERLHPDLAEGMRFSTRSFHHDFGTYREVVLLFNETDEHQVSVMAQVEGNLPEFWDEEAKRERVVSSHRNWVQETENRPSCELCGAKSVTIVCGLPLCPECALSAEDLEC